MENQNPLVDFIWQNIQRGIQPPEIRQQLATAGWKSEDIEQGFAAAQQRLNAPAPAVVEPTPDIQTADLQAAPAQATPSTGDTPAVKRGRIKTSWLLLKQSLGILKLHRGLTRYPLISMLWSLLWTLLIAGLFAVDSISHNWHSVWLAQRDYTGGNYYLTPLGMVTAAAYYIVTFFITYLYATALAAHTLDLFRGTEKSYKTYMQLARSKWRTILAFSVIAATVGFILQAIEERFRFFGWIIARVLGTLWGLGVSFVVPLIAETNNGAPKSITESVALFKKTWGENIVSRITLSGLFALFILFVLVPAGVVLVILLGAVAGSAGAVAGVLLVLLASLFLGIIQVAASNILNTALYFWAQYRQIPALFDAELLNSVFIPKKKRNGLFGRR